MNIINRSGWSACPDDEPPRLLRDHWRFSAAERSRLLTLAARVEAGTVSEETDAEARLRFYRWAVCRGLYGR